MGYKHYAIKLRARISKALERGVLVQTWLDKRERMKSEEMLRLLRQIRQPLPWLVASSRLLGLRLRVFFERL